MMEKNEIIPAIDRNFRVLTKGGSMSQLTSGVRPDSPVNWVIFTKRLPFSPHQS
jgi:hypothetical protein